MVEQQELKRCPFCGGEAEMFPYYFNEWHIGCGECSCDLGVFDTKEEAIEAWNKRVPMRNWGVCKDCALKENCAEYKPNKLQCEDYERYKEVLTNEEWFCTLSTEEKAKFMCNIYEMGKNGKEYFMRLDKCVEWLKQPHKDE